MRLHRARWDGSRRNGSLPDKSFTANAVRLQLHALAYNLGNFLRTLATPEPIKDWSLTSLKEKLIKIGAKGKMTNSILRPPFRPPQVPAAVRSSRLSCGKVGKAQIFTSARESSGESRMRKVRRSALRKMLFPSS